MIVVQPLQHPCKAYRLMISAGSGDIIQLNGWTTRVSYKQRILQRKIRIMLLVLLLIARETRAYLHHSESRRPESNPEVKFRQAERVFSRQSSPRGSLSAVQGGHDLVSPTHVHQNLKNPLGILQVSLVVFTHFSPKFVVKV